MFLVVASLVFVAVCRPTVVYVLVLGLTGVVRGIVGRFTSRYDEQLDPVALRSRLDGFYATIDTIDTITTDRRMLGIAALYAHLAMAFLMLPIYLGGMALGYRIAFPVVTIVVGLGKLGSIVPAPGGTGGVETIVTAGLTTLGGLEPAAALTIALIYRTSTYWLTITAGGVSAAFVLLPEA